MPSQATARFACLALFILPNSFLSAQGIAQDSLTLNQALATATMHAPQLRARQSAIEGARSGVTLSDARLLPSLDIGGQVTYATDNNITGAFFAQPVLLPLSGLVRPAADNGPIYGNGFGATLTWTPFTFGRITWQRRQARSELAFAMDDASDELFEVRLRVATAYLNLLRQQELIRVQEQALARADVLARSVRTLVASGLRPAADSLLANADVSRARIDVLAARRNATNAGSLLVELLGTSTAAPIVGTPFLDPLPAAADAMTQDRAISDSLADQPRLRPYVARLAVSEAKEAVVARSALPRVSLLGGLSARGSGFAPDGAIDHTLSGAFNDERVNLATGVMVNIPLTDALFTAARSSVERANTDAARADLESQTDHLRAQVTSAAADFGVARLTSDEVPEQLAAATAAYQQMSVRYAAGLTSQAELAQAQYLLTRAETDQVVARIGAWTAWLNLCAARGDLTPFLGAVR
jgi:outer membrane protein TolC